jgi:sugar lactone lactonase YvrE
MRRMWPDPELPVPADPGGDLRAAAGRDVLGECPLWDEARGVLWWVDIRAPALCRLEPARQRTERWSLPELVGSIALTNHLDGRLLVALGHRLALFNPEATAQGAGAQAHGVSDFTTSVVPAQTALQTLLTLPLASADHRFNDGRCDPAGRFWVGTMNNITRGAEGRMFRYDTAEGLVEFAQLAPGLRIPNSLAFSPDGRTMYFADSLDHAIRAFDYDPATGQPGAARAFAHMAQPAFPDGSCIDAEGGLWNTRFHGGCVVRHRPDGQVDRVITLPVRRPTCCAFGGPDLSTLYVTTTSQHMSDAERAAEPLAGALLALKVGCTGLPEPRFALH